jgi:signal transduction histidine kinase/CheY-like chemotaxis protein
MNIYKKLTLLFIFLAITPLLFFGYFSLEKTTEIIEKYVIVEAQSQADIIAHTLIVEGLFNATGADPLKVAALKKFVADFNHLYGRDIVVLGKNRMVLADAEPQNVGATFPHFSHDREKITAMLDACLAHGSQGSFEEVSDDGNFLLVAVPISSNSGDHLGLVILEYSGLYKAAVATEQILRNSLVLGVIFLGAIAVFLSFLFSRNISKPIQKLSLAAKALGEGDFSRQAEVNSGDEIGELAVSFNKMAENIGQLVNAEKKAAIIQSEINTQLRQEIEDKTRAEEALRESEELYRTLVENVDLGVALISPDHSIVKVNQALANLSKKMPEYFVAKKCFREFEKREQVCPHCPGVPAMQELRACEAEVVGPVRDDGSTMRLRIRAFPVIGKDQKAAGFIEVVEDITERKKIEDELQRAKHIELVGTLAGGIAHDFNNLLAGIMGNIALAKIYIGQEAKVTEKLNICEKAVERAKDLSQQLLTFSRGGAPVKAISSIDGLIFDSVSFALSGSNVSCNYEIANNLWAAEIDYGQMSQVFQNIVTNAVQAMPGGGVLEVRAQNIEINAGQALPLDPGNYLKISVIDQGEGIPPDILDKIFIPFFTSKKHGSGLGLAICYSIIKKHRGHIEVFSAAGVGTVFYLYIQANAEISATKKTAATTLQAGSGRILLMDDEQVVREAAADMLACLGYKVEMASDGLEAIEHYRTAKSAGQAYDLVILDLTVPGGMGGLETLAKLAEYDPEVKAIVSSGYANNAVLANYRQHGFQGIIAKPYNIDEFSKVVAEVVGLGAPGS